MPEDLPTRRAPRHRRRRRPTTYRLRIDLDDTKPPIWRRVDIDSSFRLDQLHELILAAFGWGGHHLHRFTISKRDWNPEAFVTEFDIEDGDEGTPEWTVRVDQLIGKPGDRLHYEYDFGDGWWHTLKLESVSRRDPAARPAELVTGRRYAPPDDCGGPYGYEHLLKAVNDPSHPEHKELTTWFEAFPWVGKVTKFDPLAIDLADLQATVRHALES